MFNAPFTLFSKNLKGSYRSTCAKIGKDILLFEGGKSQLSNKDIVTEGVQGTMRILHHMGMLDSQFEVPLKDSNSLLIKSSLWMRAKYSGLLHIKIPVGKHVEEGETLATITDPYGKMRHVVKSNHKGYVINVNEAPIVYKGDAIFRITKEMAT